MFSYQILFHFGGKGNFALLAKIRAEKIRQRRRAAARRDLTMLEQAPEQH
jgi:hypothetical protein